MDKYDIKLLDCTLRDGGYINDWNWGTNRAKQIIEKVVQSGIDIIEVGFLRNVDEYDSQKTISRDIRDLNALLPKNSGNTMFAAMAMISNYDISQLTSYDGTGIELIRVTAHDYDIDMLYQYASDIMALGYKVSINPINIMGYSDEDLLKIIKAVNLVRPYQFSIVDTFGSMTRHSMKRIVSLIDNNLDKSIRLGLHLHENFASSFCMAQDFADMHLSRGITIDGSLMGMGRNPGNLAMELISDYLNAYFEKEYDIDYLLDAIYDYISPIRGEIQWGYTTEFFLSARLNLHRNYAEHFLHKGDLTTRDVNHLLSRIEPGKTTVFDADYANRLYEEYKTNVINDTEAREALADRFKEAKVLIVAPGSSINKFTTNIVDYIQSNKPIVVALNFEPLMFTCDFAFFSNNKRYAVAQHKFEEILTSNIEADDCRYYMNYNSLAKAVPQGCNSLIMLLALLKDLGVKDIGIVGADGYGSNNNYYDESLHSYETHGSEFNHQVKEAIKAIGVNPRFLTPTQYGDSVWK